MATFRQRGSGFWQASFRRQNRDTVSKTFSIKSEAEKWARSIKADLDRLRLWILFLCPPDMINYEHTDAKIIALKI